MVSADNVMEITTRCVCGAGDKENSQSHYYENKCPNCGKEGTLQPETMSNVELKPNDESATDDITSDESPSIKIVCKNCGSEFCGQDGYDMGGGFRSGLTTVNPNEITGEEDEVSTTEETEPTYMSGWEGLCDLLRPLDAQAMMVQRGDYVIIKKIEIPQSAKLWAYEGINVVDESVTITDYTPEIYNTFVIRWGENYENELEFVFKKHKQLFGERKGIFEAKKYQVVEEESDEEEEDKKSDNSWSISDLLAGLTNDDKDKKKKNESKTKTSNKTEDSENGEESEDEESPNVEEVPITTKEEAIQFGLTQVGKAKRDDEHTITLKVIGNQNWMVGEWCHVKLPSFNEDSYMFISKCSFESSPDDEYINSLTLVDYPPTLGKPFPNQGNEDSEEEGEEEENAEDSENEENDDSNSSSDSSNS